MYFNLGRAVPGARPKPSREIAAYRLGEIVVTFDKVVTCNKIVVAFDNNRIDETIGTLGRLAIPIR